MDIDRIVKCVVWDLDNTLWPGVAAEGESSELPEPDPRMLEIMQELERRGIVNSLASRNDPALLAEVLAYPQLATQFVAPQISWEPKSRSLAHIAASLNIGLDSLAFIDDSPFERAEVEHLAPGVLVLAPDEVRDALDSPPFKPANLTSEARDRAEMYKAEELRRETESGFSGNRAEFLRWCQMRLSISPAILKDLPRILEMTQRTHQLNSTGRRYTEEELIEVMDNPDWLVVVARLADRFGDYGIIGAALVNTHPEGDENAWLVDLLMLSCRVEGRGIPAAMLRWIMDEARKAGAKTLRAIYLVNDRNLPIRLLFRQMGFTAVSGSEDGGPVVVERSLDGELPAYSEWLDVDASEVHTVG